MSIDAIDRMVQQANPIPDPTFLELTDVDRGSAHHDDLQVDGAEVVLIDIARTGPEWPRRRRWRVAAAAAAAVVLVAAGALVREATEDGNQTQDPTAPSPSPTTVPSATCPPWDGGAPGCGAMHLPPPGATPSTPERGVLVASIGFSAHSRVGEASFNLFADGRLIRLGGVFEYSVGDEVVPGGVVEQRLTPDGVERVRAEFLASGLFDAGQEPSSGEVLTACWCVTRVRDGGQLLSTGAEWNRGRVDPEVERRVDRLIGYILELDDSLPVSAWADREIRPYVPSRYVVSVYGPEDANGQSHPLTDPVAVLAQWVPAEIAQLVAGASSGPGAVLTTAEVRRLVDALDDDGIDTSYWPPRLQYRVYVPEGTEFLAYVDVWLLLPDGLPPLTVGS